MNKIITIKKYIDSLRPSQYLFGIYRIRLPIMTEQANEDLIRRKILYRDRSIDVRKGDEQNIQSFFFFSNYPIIFENEFLSVKSEKCIKKQLLFWNRSPGARYPKKANNGARPDCRSLRKIRKRLKTGK